MLERIDRLDVDSYKKEVQIIIDKLINKTDKIIENLKEQLKNEAFKCAQLMAEKQELQQQLHSNAIQVIHQSQHIYLHKHQD